MMRLLDHIPVDVIPPSSEGLNCGLNITTTRWIDLSGGIHNEHLSRTRYCGRGSGDDSPPLRRSGLLPPTVSTFIALIPARPGSSFPTMRPFGYKMNVPRGRRS